MTEQRYAGGGIVRELLEGVSKEAPELARGARAATRRATINVGLDINGGEKLSPDEVLAALQSFGVKPVRAAVHQSDSEPTLVIELDRSLNAEEAHKLSMDLRQEAIAQVDENGVGDLHGPAADKWKPFNGDYFIDNDGKRLSQAIMDAGEGEKPGGEGFAGGGIVREVVEGLLEAAGRNADEAADLAKPMRLYHGTTKLPNRVVEGKADYGDGSKGFDYLDPDVRNNQLGLHLGTKPQADFFANDNNHLTDADILLNKDYYATQTPEGGRIIPLDVELKNPVRLEDRTGTWYPSEIYSQLVEQGKITADRQTWDMLMDYESSPNPKDRKWAQDFIRKQINDLGHDGVVYTNRVEGFTTDDDYRSRFTQRGLQPHSLKDDEWLDVVPEAKGNDSYIVWKKDQYRSPFGDGPGVGFAGGGVVRKLGRGLVDMLDFSGVHAGNQIRDDIIKGTELRGDGRKFTGFFGDVTSGKSEKYIPHGLDNYDPAINLEDDAALFRYLRDGYSGNFDNHIKTSIPGFDEVQNAVGSSLLKTYGNDGGDILDIGSSEGALIKALSAASDGRIRTTGIDPNPAMLNTYNTKPQAPGSRSILSAFGSAEDAGKVAWEEADGTPIPFFDPMGQQYDAAHEAMVFQFISNARKAQAERVKQLLKPKGIAIFEEKFGNPKAIFDANESKKDAYKAKYYTPEQMEIKRKEVLQTGNDAVEGMTDLQVSQAEMEQILKDTFSNRAQFWDSGNFKGYVASDDARALEDFLNNLQSLESEYATTRTPRGFADGGPVWSEEDIASMTHDHSYGTGREMNYLDTLGTQIPLGEMNYYDVDGERRMPEGIQGLHDVGRLGIYAVPGAGPFIGAGLDTAEAIAEDDPLSAGMAVAFGPGGKLAKGAMTGAMAIGMDPADAEAGLYGKLSKWAQSVEGRSALDEAENMLDQGFSNREVRDRTGWFKDIDGHMKFWRPSTGGGLIEPFKGSTLEAVYKDPFLFDEYPHMKDIGFRRKNDEGAHYDMGNKEIVLGDTSKPGYNTPDAGGRYGSIIHEIYHAKADHEGWPQGTSVMTAAAAVGDDMKRFVGMKKGTPGREVGDEFLNILQSQNYANDIARLGFKRYEGEVGEVLARREASMREIAPENFGPYTPADSIFLDTDQSVMFYPGQKATPETYRALMKMIDDERVAADMQKAAAAKTMKRRR